MSINPANRNGAQLEKQQDKICMARGPITDPDLSEGCSRTPGCIPEGTWLYEAGWRSRWDVRSCKYYYHWHDGSGKAVWKLPPSAWKIPNTPHPNPSQVPGEIFCVPSIHGGHTDRELAAIAAAEEEQKLRIEAAANDGNSAHAVLVRAELGKHLDAFDEFGVESAEDLLILEKPDYIELGLDEAEMEALEAELENLRAEATVAESTGDVDSID